MEKIRVMLVDDDRLAVSYMKEIVDWEKLGYEIVAAAYNGKQALKLIGQCSPHLVITDISMPHMGGIELSKKIKEISKDIRVVLLTAYGEFEYAREAVQLGVDYYLIKDEVDSAYMEEKLKALKGLIVDHARLSQMMFQKAVVDYFQMGERYVREFYQDKAMQSFLDGKYQYIVVEQNLPFMMDEKWELKPREQNLPAFLEECMKVAVEAGIKVKLHSLLPKNRILFVLDKQGRSEYEEQQKNYYAAERIKARVNGEGGFRCTVYVSDYPMAFSCLYEILTQENSILQAKLYLGTGKCHSLSQNPWKEGKAEPALFSAQDYGKAIEEKEFQEKIKEEYAACYLKRGTTGLLLQQFRIAYRALLREEKRYAVILSGNDSMCEQLYDFPEMFSWLNQYYEKVEKLRKESLSQKAYRPEVEMAIAYIRKHYADSWLKVSDIAGYLKISESRLSVIFKAETGKTLIQYLTAVRIEKAKQLLRTSQYKVYEIAEMVGYSNSQYLSNVFYKETGCFPLDYRNRSQGE